ATAEGMQSTANVHYAQIIRKNENGDSGMLLEVQEIIDEREPDVKLKPNDIVFIRDGGKGYEEYLAKSGHDPVPEVSPQDLKTVWRLSQEHTGADTGEILEACAPGVNARAILDRIGALQILWQTQDDPEVKAMGLPWKRVVVNDAALSVLAKIPMRMPPQDSGDYLFDVNLFNHLVHKLSKSQ